MKPDLYSVLGVARGAGGDEIKRAYRSLAKAKHPDVGGSRGEFEAIQQAHEVLIDAERRAKYDATGEIGGPAANPLAGVMEVLDGLLAAVVSQMNDLRGEDVVQLMRDRLREEERKIAQAIAGIPAKAAKIDKLAARFHCASGENVIRKSLELRAEAMRKQVADATAHREKIRAAIKFLDTYSFDVESQGMSHIFTTFGATTATYNASASA